MEGVEVWCGSLERPSAEIAELSRYLDAAELHRASQFRALQDRQRFVVSRGILRSLLGDYTGVAPDRVAIRILPGGKPALRKDADSAPLRFNLSHCNDMIVLAFSSGEVGIDIQREEGFEDMPRVVENFFSAEEAIAFERLAGQERSRFFFRTWVRKEAYMKATGEGLAIEPSSLTVSASPASSVRITRESNSVYLDHRYQIHDIEEFSGYSTAVAVVCGGGDSVIPVVRAFPSAGVPE
jgi:4'-phosphopantetheinyl transferase